MSFQIAIDGPVAAGKGTVAKLVAKRLGYLYVDTGATYRIAAFLAKEADIDLTDEAKVAALADQADINMHNPKAEENDGRQTTVIVNGKDISWAIRTEEIGKGASFVAKHKEVRKVLVKKQQNIASSQNVVMEGRDITYRVLPNAQLKIYLTADDKVRAHRRHQELLIRGQDISYETVLDDLKARDKQDTERSTDPLQVIPGAWVLDTSDLTINQVVDQIEQRVKETL